MISVILIEMVLFYRMLRDTFNGCLTLIHGPTIPTQLSYTFQHCTNLKSVRIKFHHESTYEEDYTPGTCAGDNYEEFPFWDCSALTDIYVETAEDKEAVVDYWGGMFTSQLSKDLSTITKVVPEPEPEPPTPPGQELFKSFVIPRLVKGKN